MSVYRNQLGYQCLSPEMTKKVLGKYKDEAYLAKADKIEVLEYLRKFDRGNPEERLPDDNLFTDSFATADLLGRNIVEHFELMADSLFPNSKHDVYNFLDGELPDFPFNFKGISAGWSKWDGVKWVKVPHILEEYAVFDVETFVKSKCGNWAVMAGAVTLDSYYLWCHECWLDPSKIFYPEAIDLGPIVKYIINHNTCFDRARTKEAYELRPEKIIWIDTRSMFNVAHGLTSDLMKLYESCVDPFDISQNPYCQYGAKADLVSVYNYYFRKKNRLEPEEKTIRNVFRDSLTIEQMHQVGGFYNLMEYALNDCKYTFQIGIKTLCDYLDHSPSEVSWASMIILGQTKMSLDNDWKVWFQNCENIWNEKQAFIKSTLLELCEEAAADVGTGEVDIDDDPFLCHLDWTTDWKMTRKVHKQYELYSPAGTIIVEVPHGEKVGEFIDNYIEENYGTINNFELTSKGAYKKKKIDERIENVPRYPNQYGIPKWLVKVRKNGMSTKTLNSHYILGLSWQGFPVYHSKETGWTYCDNDGTELKVPHKKGDDVNVGNMLTTDFIAYYEKGIMQARNPKARELMEAHVACSYWTSVRKRVSEVLIREVRNPLGKNAIMCAGQVSPHNTVSGRGGQQLWYTVPGTEDNQHKIGTEIKSRVAAPDGWDIVGGDIDSQEAKIFGMYADADSYGITGCTPISNIIITGSKKNKDDVHYTMAKVGDIPRKPAKTINYAVQYGAGFPTVDGALKKYNPVMPKEERQQLVEKILEIKKGVKRGKYYEGGMDSHGFNYITDLIEIENPQTPFLDCIMSKPLQAANDIQNRCATTRINWTIQRSGSEMLACMLVACEYLNRKYELMALFLISLHDEIFYLTPSEKSRLFAACFLQAHIWSWGLFHYKLGLTDIPLQTAFISGVYVGNRWSKDLHPTNTISNPENDQKGVELTSKDLIPYLNQLFGKTECLEKLST